MAKQDAIRAGLGFRDGVSGLASIDPRVSFEIEDGESTSSQADLVEGDALAILVVHSEEAEDFARTQLAISSDVADRNRWSAILASIEALRREAGRRIG